LVPHSIKSELSPTNKKRREKFSEFWQIFLTSAISTDFSDYVPIKNSDKKFAEYLPSRSTAKPCLLELFS
jgi:hypothetical protein